MKHMRITSKLASMAPLACSIAMGIGVWASPAGAETVGGGILESGAWVSDLFPAIGEHADDLCFLKGMHTEGVAHGPV